MSDDPQKGSLIRRVTQEHYIVLFLLLVAAASAMDLVSDFNEGVNTSHLVQEGLILAVATFSMAWILVGLRRKSRELMELHRELEHIKAASPSQPEEVVEAKQQMAAVIANQFSAWSLTNSEREIGLLLLKGFSLKEIAALRGRTEKTIRQQASSIYKKAGLAGRHAFSAWFIEDFL